MVIELNDDMVKEIVVKEMADIISINYIGEDIKDAATRIIRYYLRANEYQRYMETGNWRDEDPTPGICI